MQFRSAVPGKQKSPKRRSPFACHGPVVGACPTPRPARRAGLEQRHGPASTTGPRRRPQAGGPPAGCGGPRGPAPRPPEWRSVCGASSAFDQQITSLRKDHYPGIVGNNFLKYLQHPGPKNLWKVVFFFVFPQCEFFWFFFLLFVCLVRVNVCALPLWLQHLLEVLPSR